MLVFISDLHLAEEKVVSSINLDELSARLSRLVADAFESGITSVRIVLLGDIFELLKSPRWIEGNLRPWIMSAEVTKLVEELVNSVLAANPKFGSLLRNLKANYPNLDITYLPGNHDRLVNETTSTTAREALRRVIPLQGHSTDTFDQIYLDLDHAVLAYHGHEFDKDNFSPNGEVVVGDVIVVELLTRLPKIVASRLGLYETDRRLGFLHEVDNVLPQDMVGIGAWLAMHVRLLAKETDCNDCQAIVADGLKQCLDEIFLALGRSVAKTSERLVNLQKIAEKMLEGGDLLQFVGPITFKSEPSYIQHATLALEQAGSVGSSEIFKFFVMGHTHHSKHEQFLFRNNGEMQPGVLLNSGTWRRVQRLIKGDAKSLAFSTFDEATILVLYKGSEMGITNRRYEFHNFASGN